MDDIAPNILVETKNEYTHQLTNILIPYIYEGIASIYDDSEKLHEDNKGESTVLKTFQAQLKKVPKWNQEIIDAETQRILDRTQCEWLSDLITAVFISHTKILSVVTKKDTSSKEKINVKIPQISRFVHKCYIECAREFFKNPFLIDKEDLTTAEKQRNMRESLQVIEQCIINAVRKLLPVQDILRKYLGDALDEDDIEGKMKPLKKEDANKDLFDKLEAEIINPDSKIDAKKTVEEKSPESSGEASSNDVVDESAKPKDVIDETIKPKEVVDDSTNKPKDVVNETTKPNDVVDETTKPKDVVEEETTKPKVVDEETTKPKEVAEVVETSKEIAEIKTINLIQETPKNTSTDKKALSDENPENIKSITIEKTPNDFAKKKQVDTEKILNDLLEQSGLNNADDVEDEQPIKEIVKPVEQTKKEIRRVEERERNKIERKEERRHDVRKRPEENHRREERDKKYHREREMSRYIENSATSESDSESSSDDESEDERRDRKIIRRKRMVIQTRKPKIIPELDELLHQRSKSYSSSEDEDKKVFFDDADESRDEESEDEE